MHFSPALALSAYPPAFSARTRLAAKNALLAFVAGVFAYAPPSSRTRSTPSTMPRGLGHRGREEGDADGGKACDSRGDPRPIYSSGKRLRARVASSLTRHRPCHSIPGIHARAARLGTSQIGARDVSAPFDLAAHGHRILRALRCPRMRGPLCAGSGLRRRLVARAEVSSRNPPCIREALRVLHAAAFVSFVGFFGVLRKKASHVRLYRDCSTADLAFTAFLTVLAAYAASRVRSSRSSRPTRRATASSSVPPSRSSRACSSSPPSAYTSSSPSPPRRHRTGGSATALRLLPLPPNVRAADVVYAPTRACARMVHSNSPVCASSYSPPSDVPTYLRPPPTSAFRPHSFLAVPAWAPGRLACEERAQLLALLSPDETWLERTPHGHARPLRHPPAPPPRRLCALRAKRRAPEDPEISTKLPRSARCPHPGRHHSEECDAPLPPNVRAADVVYIARGQPAEVWVRAPSAPPRRTRGCSTRARCTASASGSNVSPPA
ncbi:hypothetical protein FB451DRAFT_1566627 [Mycena latifolia]|nr:hypothetical protein FB451DRAFT_1566627 [Mycena latifolia]